MKKQYDWFCMTIFTLKLNICFDLPQTIVGEASICPKVLWSDIVDSKLHPLGVAVLTDLIHLEPASIVDRMVLASTIIDLHPIVDRLGGGFNLWQYKKLCFIHLQLDLSNPESSSTKEKDIEKVSIPCIPV